LAGGDTSTPPGLVRSVWAQQRIRLLADALLHRGGTLNGDEIAGLASNQIVTPAQGRAHAVAGDALRGAAGNI
jgi:hypothetical protein